MLRNRHNTNTSSLSNNESLIYANPPIQNNRPLTQRCCSLLRSTPWRIGLVLILSGFLLLHYGILQPNTQTIAAQKSTPNPAADVHKSTPGSHNVYLQNTQSTKKHTSTEKSGEMSYKDTSQSTDVYKSTEKSGEMSYKDTSQSTDVYKSTENSGEMHHESGQSGDVVDASSPDSEAQHQVLISKSLEGSQPKSQPEKAPELNSQSIENEEEKSSPELSLQTPPQSPNITEVFDLKTFGSCKELALKSKEPYSNEYEQRNQVIDLNGPPMSYYLWNGTITREDFEATMAAREPTLTFKIKDGQLYQKIHPNNYLAYDNNFRKILLMQFLMTLYLYEIPDLDFTFFFRDEAACGLPFFSNNINADCDWKSGFALPSYGAYSNALGKVQLGLYERCIEWKYPSKDITPKAIWRGSTTGIPRITIHNYHELWRLQLVKLTKKYPQLFDTGLIAYIQMEGRVEEILRKEFPLAKRIEFDEFNKYGFVIDMDGNAWSDRFHFLLFTNRPILKQKSPYNEYFRFEPEVKLATIFNRNLSNLVEITELALDRLKTEEGRKSIELEVENRRKFAHEHVSQLGILRSTAYALTVYSKKQTWEVEEDRGYFKITSKDTERKHNTFPEDFVSAVMEYFKN
eukprot:g5697.t1